jgi:hypothetical protein
MSHSGIYTTGKAIAGTCSSPISSKGNEDKYNFIFYHSAHIASGNIYQEKKENI